jgi:starch phosphorylase
MWAAPQWMELGRELIGSEDLGSLSEPDTWQRLQQVDTAHMWWIRSQLRKALVEDVRARIRRSWLERGASDAELGWIATAFDPDVLTIGFARRVPTYKRLTLMLRDPDRLEKLLLDKKRSIQLIVAGKSHPADDGGKALIQQVVKFADRPEVRHRIAFLPDYDMSMARQLYYGCDVWLNNPLRPLEACGTSGMKSALNGGLNLSVRDGWWDEWYDGENGWEIPTADGLLDEGRRDDIEAAARAVGRAEVLRPRRAWRPDALGGDGASHADGARPEGAGVADGARLHGEVLRPGGAVTAQDRRTRRGRGAVRRGT